jgi:hypothetical protein
MKRSQKETQYGRSNNESDSLMEKLYENPNYFLGLREDLQTNRDFIIKLLENDVKIWDYILHFHNDMKVINCAVGKHVPYSKLPKIHQTREVATYAILHGELLRDLPGHLRTDIEIVKLAVARNLDELAEIKRHLLEDYDVIAAALKKNQLDFCKFPKSVQKNQRVRELALQVNGENIQFMDAYLTRELVLIAVKSPGNALRLVKDKTYLEDIEIAEESVRTNHHALKYIHVGKHMTDLCVLALLSDVRSIQYCPRRILEEDHEVFKTAVLQDGRTLRYFRNYMRKHSKEVDVLKPQIIMNTPMTIAWWDDDESLYPYAFRDHGLALEKITIKSPNWVQLAITMNFAFMEKNFHNLSTGLHEFIVFPDCILRETRTPQILLHYSNLLQKHIRQFGSLYITDKILRILESTEPGVLSWIYKSHFPLEWTRRTDVTITFV